MDIYEKRLRKIAGMLAETLTELTLTKVALEYAIADIPHKCQFCMSHRCVDVCDCKGCENGSHWHWYGLMEV